MAMSNWDKRAQQEIIKRLGKQGYKTYGDLFSLYHFNGTRNPGVLGYMEPTTGTIVANVDLSLEEVCVTIRHEILHYYLEHTLRIAKKIAAEHNRQLSKEDIYKNGKLDPENDSIKDLIPEIFNDITNYAADFDISNQAYTDKDKNIIRGMNALVTEDFHEDWVNLTMEEMIDRLRKEGLPKPKFVYGALMSPSIFVSGRRIYGKV